MTDRQLKTIPWTEPEFNECDIIPEDGHSQQHGVNCRYRREDAVCRCGLPLYDGHIKSVFG